MNRVRPNDPCPCGSGRKYKRCHGPKEALQALEPVGLPTRRLRAGIVHPALPVPAAIPRPDYALNGGRPRRSKESFPVIKGPEALERMRAACRVARAVLDTTLAAVARGVTTEALERVAHEACVAFGAYPSALAYLGFPKSICTSVNEVICHGIPDDRPLEEGDVVNIDITVFYEGMHGDCSETVLVGQVDPVARELARVTRECLLAGIGAVRPGALVREIGRAIQPHADAHGFGVVRSFVGHGVGELFHMDPQVPHFFDASARYELRPGMTFTIEPMINVGTWRHQVWPDKWTAVTADGKLSAQYEHTVLVTENGVEVLTLRPDEPQPFP